VTNAFGAEVETFDLDFATDGGEECHHPAWNISGDRILCHRHEPRERFGDIQNRQFLRMLYLFAYDAFRGGWSSPTRQPQRVFEPRPPARMEAQFPQFESSRCNDYFYKYGEWCGTDDHVLVTVYCKDVYDAVVSSRVMVIDTSTDPPTYRDVTAAIEDYERVPRDEQGTWRGLFGTCGPVHQGRNWTPVAG
jgi:hypothetical protein